MSQHKKCPGVYLITNPGTPPRIICCELPRHLGEDHEGAGVKFKAKTDVKMKEKTGGAQLSGKDSAQPNDRDEAVQRQAARSRHPSSRMARRS